MRSPDGLAPVRHIHSRQAQRRERGELHRSPGSHGDPRRRPQVHRSSSRPSFRVQGPLQRARHDNVELYFFQNCYVGISAIENGATNVCGLAPERSLRPFGFHPGTLKQSICSFSGPALLRPASKQWPPCGALPRAWPFLRIPSYAVRARSSEPKGSRLHHVTRRAVEQSIGPSARGVARKSGRLIELESCCGPQPRVRRSVNLLQSLTIEL
jgi:hypothetical protein